MQMCRPVNQPPLLSLHTWIFLTDFELNATVLASFYCVADVWLVCSRFEAEKARSVIWLLIIKFSAVFTLHRTAVTYTIYWQCTGPLANMELDFVCCLFVFISIRSHISHSPCYLSASLSPKISINIWLTCTGNAHTFGSITWTVHYYCFTAHSYTESPPIQTTSSYTGAGAYTHTRFVLAAIFYFRCCV